MDRKDNFIADSKTLQMINDKHITFTEETLINASNKGTYKRGLKDLDNYGVIKIYHESENVRVLLDYTEVIIRPELSECSCSCPSKVLCRHIISAACAVSELCVSEPSDDQNTDCKDDKPAAVVYEPTKEDLETLSGIKSEVSKILSKGFVNCGENDTEIFRHLASRCSSKMKRLSNLCRTCAENIDLMNKKNAGFVPVEAIRLVCLLYNTADTMSVPEGLSLFAARSFEGESNSDFICTGVYPRKTKSGYYGITAVLYGYEEKCFYTYNYTLPTFYNNKNNYDISELRGMLERRIHWCNKMSVSAISGSLFRLTGFKCDTDMRISSSQATVCSIKRELSLSDIPEGFVRIPEYREIDYFTGGSSDEFYLIRDPSIEDVNFDKALQLLTFTLSDMTDAGVRCSIVYNEISTLLIDFIEKHNNEVFKDSFLLMRRYLNNDFPVSLIYQHTVKNIWF